MLSVVVVSVIGMCRCFIVVWLKCYGCDLNLNWYRLNGLVSVWCVNVLNDSGVVFGSSGVLVWLIDVSCGFVFGLLSLYSLMLLLFVSVVSVLAVCDVGVVKFLLSVLCVIVSLRCGVLVVVGSVLVLMSIGLIVVVSLSIVVMVVGWVGGLVMFVMSVVVLVVLLLVGMVEVVWVDVCGVGR